MLDLGFLLMSAGFMAYVIGSLAASIGDRTLKVKILAIGGAAVFAIGFIIAAKSS